MTTYFAAAPSPPPDPATRTVSKWMLDPWEGRSVEFIAGMAVEGERDAPAAFDEEKKRKMAGPCVAFACD
jgi:hypothetical protein